MWRAVLYEYEGQNEVFFTHKVLADLYVDRMNAHARELRRTHSEGWSSADPFWEVEKVEPRNHMPICTPSKAEIDRLRQLPTWTPHCGALSGSLETGIVTRCKAPKDHPEGEHDWWVDTQMSLVSEPDPEKPGWNITRFVSSDVSTSDVFTLVSQSLRESEREIAQAISPQRPL